MICSGGQTAFQTSLPSQKPFYVPLQINYKRWDARSRWRYNSTAFFWPLEFRRKEGLYTQKRTRVQRPLSGAGRGLGMKRQSFHSGQLHFLLLLLLWVFPGCFALALFCSIGENVIMKACVWVDSVANPMRTHLDNQPKGVNFHTSLLTLVRCGLIAFHCSVQLMKIFEDWAQSNFYVK